MKYSSYSTQTELLETKLEELAEVNPESLGVKTSPNFQFRYIDISSVTSGVIDWHLVTNQTLSSAPSRARRVVRPNDVLLCTVRPALQAHAFADWLETDGYVCSTGFAVIRCGDKLHPPYLRHLVFDNYIGTQLRKLEIGSSYPAVNESDVRSLTIPLLPKAEQIKIAETLDTIDSTIAHTSTLIAKLKQMKAGLLHDLLTRGLDENGKLRDAIEHPEQFKDSPLGQVPKDWEVAPARSFCSLITKGTTPPASSFSSDPSQVRYIRVDNLTFTGELNLNLPPLYVDENTHRTFLARSCVFGGDVLMNIVGPPLGKIALVPPNSGEWNSNQAIAIFRVVRDISPEFLLYWLQSRTAQTWFLQRAKQTSGQVNLTLELCQTLPVPIPPPEEQTKIISVIRGVNQRISTEEENLKKLNTLKKGLMSDLLTGRVRVTDLKEIPA